MPKEVVVDQDTIICVTENNGDIVYTYEFEKFRQECGLEVYMCRGADPESKGKIENTVKYIKGNFLENRLYVDDSILNQSCLEWLERTGNAKRHGTTKKFPVKVFEEEKEYLRPLPFTPENQGYLIQRRVRKDNTILYNSNRYTVPLGSYHNNPEVLLEIDDCSLRIFTIFHEPLCEHRLSSGKGNLIQNTNHLRDRSTALDQLQQDLDEQLNHEATEFLCKVRADKPRYGRDQFRLLQTLIDSYNTNQVLDAISFCNNNQLYSTNLVRDYLEHQQRVKSPELPMIDLSQIPVDDPKYHITTQKRPLEVYAKVGGKA